MKLILAYAGIFYLPLNLIQAFIHFGRQNKTLCSALKLYPNIFFYFIHTCTLFRKAIPLHIHYTLFRLFAQQQLTLPVLHNRIYANFSHQPFFPHLLSQYSPPLQPLTAFSLLRQTDLFQIPIYLQYPVKF